MVLSVVALGALAAVLGVGCMGDIGDGPPSPSSTFPAPDSAIGRAPLSYPVGIEDDIIIEDARTHLANLAADDDERPVLGVILFRSSQPIEVLDQLARDYELEGGVDASVTLVIGDSRIGLSVGSSTVSSEWATAQTDGQLSSLPANFRADYPDLLPAVPPQVAAVSLWGPPQVLKQLWDDRPDSIRLIGVAGHEGNLMGAWRHPLPSEDLR